jgi:hypothetical protein
VVIVGRSGLLLVGHQLVECGLQRGRALQGKHDMRQHMGRIERTPILGQCRRCRMIAGKRHHIRVVHGSRHERSGGRQRGERRPGGTRQKCCAQQCGLHLGKHAVTSICRIHAINR